MAQGDWRQGSSLRPLRAVVEFDPQTGQVTQATGVGEVYSPLGTLLKTVQFAWLPADPTDDVALQRWGTKGFRDFMQSEGLRLFGAP
jgi:hypothetical protein